MMRALIMLAVLTPGALKAQSSPATPAVIDYLSAIDLPLTAEDTVRLGASNIQLRQVALDARRPLYTRGRAIAAYAQVADFRGLDWLATIARSPLPRPLRRQAVISISEIYGPIAPAQVIGTLIELLPSMPWNQVDLLKRLSVVSAPEPARPTVSDSR